MRRRIKRLVDFGVATLLLILCAPLMLAVSLYIRLSMGSPILFAQVRPGKHGNPFKLFKFRSMSDKRGPDGVLLPDADRLTSVGRFLRRSSLDELPQLWNVLRGDLSLVGPRPLLMEYLDRYTPEQARRHQVVPGITGWAQVNGRNALSWEEKFDLDVWYVDNWSLALDFRILALTILHLFHRDGISQPGHATAEKFLGTKCQPTTKL